MGLIVDQTQTMQDMDHW